MSKRLPINIQLFAESGEPTGGTPPTEQTSPAEELAKTSGVDYEKIKKMLEGTLAAKEDTALKAYFKEQGLAADEMKEAIRAFKEQKASQQPEAGTMQQELAKARQEVQQGKLNNAAIVEALNLGLDIKIVPHILKLADMSAALDQDGKVNTAAIQKALNQVLEDVPQLKPQNTQTTGFRSIGADPQAGQSPAQATRQAVPTKKWNRFN